MKREGRRKNYSLLFSIFSLLMVMCCLSCPSPLDGVRPKQTPELPPNTGLFRLNLSGVQRTILPETPALSYFTALTLVFTPTSGGTVTGAAITKTVSPYTGGALDPVPLKAGTYSLTVNAYRGAVAPANIAARGTLTNIEIGAGQTVTRSVTLNALISEAGVKGTFSWNITVPDFVNTAEATMKIKPLDTVNGTAEQTVTLNFSDGLTAAGSNSLNCGPYNVAFYLKETDVRALEWDEIVHIYANLDSVFTKEFTEDHFSITHYSVFVQFNNGASAEQSVLHGDTYVPITPTRDGHSFLGWYTLDNTLYDPSTKVYSNFTLIAKWIEVSTPDDPFLVTDATELRYVGKGDANPDGYKGWTVSAYYRQTANITLNSTNWTPIGRMWDPFAGSYNGGGYTITGLTSSGNDYQGMFGYIGPNGKVENLGLIGVNITGTTSNVGGIAGFNAGTIQNCYVSGSVTGTQDVGGIVGYNQGTILNCYVSGSVIATNVSSSSSGVGGIAGYNSTGTIRNCVALNASVKLTGAQTNIGRILGKNYSGTFQSNYAWSGMELMANNNPITPTGDTVTGMDGASITATNARTQAAWVTAGFTFDANSPWVWNSANSRPVLRNEAPQPWPTYFVDPPEGAGTLADPFLVRNETELLRVGRAGANPTGYTNWGLGAHYKQTANITLPPGNWNRIGTYISGQSAASFTGTYNGDGYTVTGLSLSASADYQGMFGCIGTNGKVENLGLINVNIEGAQNIGGIAGNNSGTIENCYVSGDVTGTYNVGGIAGNNDNGTIQYCYVSGEVRGTGTGTNNVGGIAGNNNGGNIERCVALNNSVTLTSTNINIGRITMSGGGTLYNNYAWNGMTLTNGSGTVTVAATSTHNGKDGESITAAKAKTDSWWIATTWNFYSLWQLNGANGMPSFKINEGNSTVQPWPEYFVDLPGTEGNPFIVASATELLKVGMGTGSGNDPYKDWTLDKHYRQTDNLTLTPAAAGQSNWNPIGALDNQFTGTYNGDGYTITGLTINSTSDYQGMFGYIGSGGRVENLGLIDVNIKGGDNIGGIAGYNNGETNGTIGNCYVSGSVTGTSYVGGIVGDNNNGYILNCYATGDVTGTSYVGGIAGRMLNGGIQRCVALNKSVTLTGTDINIGRITGPISGSFSNNYAWDGMALTANNSPVTVTPDAGGKQGADITMAAVKTQTTWVNAPLWFFSDANQTWVWDSVNLRPRLKNEVPQPWPEYLQ